jgi:hypothetical protein
VRYREDKPEDLEGGRPMMKAAGRWRDENPEELDRLHKAVREWREANPDGSPDEMVAALAGQFRADWEPVLRANLFRADLTDAEVTTGITIIVDEAGR